MSMLSFLTDAQFADITTYIGNPNGNDSDRIFNWAEQKFPALFAPKTTSLSLSGYYLRYYPQTRKYVATKNGRVYYFDPAGGTGPVDLGDVASFLNTWGVP
ncbi:MAG: hypothetical protein ACYC2R_00525 [Burkholderiales bacterium]